ILCSNIDLFANIILYSSLQQIAAVDLFFNNTIRSNIPAAQNRLDDHSLQQYGSIDVNDLRSSLQRFVAVCSGGSIQQQRISQQFTADRNGRSIHQQRTSQQYGFVSVNDLCSS